MNLARVYEVRKLVFSQYKIRMQVPSQYNVSTLVLTQCIGSKLACHNVFGANSI